MREFYNRANLDPEMIEKAINTSPEDFWFPEAKLLKSGNAADTITVQGVLLSLPAPGVRVMKSQQ